MPQEKIDKQSQCEHAGYRRHAGKIAFKLPAHARPQIIGSGGNQIEPQTPPDKACDKKTEQWQAGDAAGNGGDFERQKSNRRGQQDQQPPFDIKCLKTVKRLLPTLEEHKLAAECVPEQGAEGISQQRTQRRCDRGDCRQCPSTRARAENHRHQQKVGRHREDGAFDKRHCAQYPACAAVGGESQNGVIKRSQHARTI